MVVYKDKNTLKHYYFYDLDHFLECVIASESHLAQGIRNNTIEYVPITPDVKGWHMKWVIVNHLMCEEGIKNGQSAYQSFDDEYEAIDKIYTKYRSNVIQWDYKGYKELQGDLHATQKDWNQTLATNLNQIVQNSNPLQKVEEKTVYEVSAELEWLMKSLLYYDGDKKQFNGINVKYVDNYRNTIVCGNSCIEVLNYEDPSDSIKFSILELDGKVDGPYMDSLGKLIDIYPYDDHIPALASFYDWLNKIIDSCNK